MIALSELFISHFVSFFWDILLSLAFAFHILTTNPYAFMGLGGRVLTVELQKLFIVKTKQTLNNNTTKWRQSTIRLFAEHIYDMGNIFLIFIELSLVLDVKLKSDYLFCFYSRKISGVLTTSNMFWVFIQLTYAV